MLVINWFHFQGFLIFYDREYIMVLNSLLDIGSLNISVVLEKNIFTILSPLLGQTILD